MEEQIKKAETFVTDFTKFEHDSIDLFLTINREHSEIGKKAVYLFILDSEAKNKKRLKEKNWYTTLFCQMISGIIHPDDIEQFTDNNVTIITFNYDRSLENYLYYAFMNYSDSKSEADKIQILKKFKIHHVYGKLVDLSWENEKESLKFGQDIWANQLNEKKTILRLFVKEIPRI